MAGQHRATRDLRREARREPRRAGARRHPHRAGPDDAAAPRTSRAQAARRAGAGGGPERPVQGGEHVAAARPRRAGEDDAVPRHRRRSGRSAAGGSRCRTRRDRCSCPHQAYLPIGTLREAVSYPAAAGTFSDEAIAEALQLVDLGHLAGRLDESEPWDQQLSVDEQQRLTFARAFLHRPTGSSWTTPPAALDEAMEQRVYKTLAQRLPGTAVLSITNRPTVAQFHQRHWTIVAAGGRQRRAADGVR